MNNNQTKLYWIVGVGALLAVVALVVSMLNARQSCVSNAGGLAGITVTGHGERSTVPDVAHVSFATVSRRKGPREAVEKNALLCRAVTAAIRKAGVEKKDIQTRNYSVGPWVKYDKDYNTHQLGYEVTNSIRVTVRDITKVGAIADAGAKAGATSVEGVSFEVSNTKRLGNMALADAVKDACGKAEVAAKALGVGVGEPRSIVEAGAEQIIPQTVLARSSARHAKIALSRTSTPISPGRQRVEQDVMVTFAIR